jgi:hypothetical protein
VRRGLIAPGFESAAPAKIVGHVLGGDAVEAIEPLLEAAVVGVDVVDVQVRRFGGRLSRRGHSVEGNAGSAGEGGQRLAAIADEVISRGHNPRQRGGDRGAVIVRQDSVESRALPVASDEDGNVVLIGARMPGRSASLTRLARQVGPTAFEGFENKSLIRLDDSA